MASADEPAAVEPPVNPAPPGAETIVFVVREVVALLFVFVWLALVVWDILEGTDQRVPFWLSVVGVGVLGYALGLNVAVLTAFRKPTPAAVARRVVERRAGE